MPVDIASDYPIYRLSALIYVAMLLTTLCGALLCLAILQPITCAALLCLAMLQATIQFTDYALIYEAILQTILCCALLCLAILQLLSTLPTIRSDLHGDTTNDSLLCSTLSRNTTTDYPIYRLSAVICIAILQMTFCYPLLYLAIYSRLSNLPTIQSTDYPL
jgi:hypothetical protein